MRNAIDVKAKRGVADEKGNANPYERGKKGVKKGGGKVVNVMRKARFKRIIAI